MGGILCISSTMVIVKAFEELKLKGKPFTHIVYGIEIIEDIVGILLMVILSTIAMSQSANIVQEISTTALRVVFFLVLWFVGGITNFNVHASVLTEYEGAEGKVKETTSNDIHQ